MKRQAAVTAMLLMSCGPAAAATAVGEWLVADKTAKIGIAPCVEEERKDALCGNIVWTLTPPGLDEKNPDPEKRSRSVLGIEILQAMKPTAPNRWEGSVYNAQNGKTYKAVITLENPDALKLEGCVLGGLLCGGETWTRVTESSSTHQKTQKTQAPPRSTRSARNNP
jgi:uncharacterized protein (DUF2147 family)